jgi:hypothetical protein
VVDSGQFPVRVVKDGRFQSHVDMLGLAFAPGDTADAAAAYAASGSQAAPTPAPVGAADPSGQNCNRDLNGPGGNACRDSDYPVCEGFIEGASWGRCHEFLPVTVVTGNGISGYAEIFAWPRCFAFAADISHDSSSGTGGAGAVTASLTMSLDGGAVVTSTATTATAGAAAGGSARVSLRFCVDDTTGQLEHAPDTEEPPAAGQLLPPVRSIEAGLVDGAGAVSGAHYNATRGAWTVRLPAASGKSFPAQLDSVNDWPLSLSNPTAAPVAVHLELFRLAQVGELRWRPLRAFPRTHEPLTLTSSSSASPARTAQHRGYRADAAAAGRLALRAPGAGLQELARGPPQVVAVRFDSRHPGGQQVPVLFTLTLLLLL